MNETDTENLAELSLNYWRLKKWVDNNQSESKKSANRALEQIMKYLDLNGIKLIDLTGRMFDPGYSVDVLGKESKLDLPEEKCIVKEMVRPIITYNGNVLKLGKVVLGDNILENNINVNEKSSEEQNIKHLQKDIIEYCSSDYKEESIAYNLSMCRIKLERRIIEKRIENEKNI